MAAKKTNGHDPVTSEMLDVLREIRDELRGNREELRGNREELRGTNSRLDSMNIRLTQVHGEVLGTNQRLDALHEDVIVVQAKLTGVQNELSGFRAESPVQLGDIRTELHDLNDREGARLAKVETDLERFKDDVEKLKAAVFRPTGT